MRVMTTAGPSRSAQRTPVESERLPGTWRQDGKDREGKLITGARADQRQRSAIAFAFQGLQHVLKAKRLIRRQV